MAQTKRKQRFFDVEMPIIGKETQLYGFDTADLVNRTITYDLTRMLRGKNMIIKLRTKEDAGKITSFPVELIVLPSFTRRMIRKGTNYVEDSFSTDCKNARVSIKPFLITRKKVSREVRKSLREKAKEEISVYLKDKEVETIFDDIIKSKIQKHLSITLKKIYPLSLCEIRMFKVEKPLALK